MGKTTALITGASGGIGYELARILAKDCSLLVLASRRKDRLEDVKKELEALAPVTVRIIATDLARSGAADEIYAELEREKIAVDILVNNAGFGHLGAFAETDGRIAQDMLAVNVQALTRLTRLFLDGMIARRRGTILNVASTAAFQPGPLMAVYYASKAYVLSFSEALAAELKGTGVSVTALCPGPTATGFQLAAGMKDSRLFTWKRPASAGKVAAFAYRAMRKGKPLAVHGVVNKVRAFSVRFTPRPLLSFVVRRLNASGR